MQAIAVRCPNCTGEVLFDNDPQRGHCQYCGSLVLLQQQKPGEENAYAQQHRQQARQCRQNKDYAQEECHWDNVLRVDPGSVEAWLGKYQCQVACKGAGIHDAYKQLRSHAPAALKAHVESLESKRRHYERSKQELGVRISEVSQEGTAFNQKSKDSGWKELLAGLALIAGGVIYYFFIRKQLFFLLAGIVGGLITLKGWFADRLEKSSKEDEKNEYKRLQRQMSLRENERKRTVDAILALEYTAEKN